MKMLCLIIASALPAVAPAYEKAFEKTKPGSIEVKTLPERTVIVAQRDQAYFDKNNDMFMNLFRYIKKNDVSMTVPVKAEMDPGKMYFYVGKKDLSKELKSTDNVKVIVEPELQVLSIGIRGGYSEKNFEQARKKLFDHLEASKEWKPNGPAYAVYWNGPFVPGFMKQFEVHIPVERKRKVEQNE